jgi:hypothetical protein
MCPFGHGSSAGGAERRTYFLEAAAPYCCAKTLSVHHSENCALMSPMGHTRSFGDVGSMFGLPESGYGWAIFEYMP